MPRSSAIVSVFDKGIVTSVDPGDLHPEAAQYSLDIDPRSIGRLQGRPQDTRVDTNALNVEQAEFLTYSDGTVDLVAVTESGTMVRLADFFGAHDYSHYDDYHGKCVAVANQAAHFGCGTYGARWLGRRGHSFFGTGSETDVVSADGEVKNIAGAGITISDFLVYEGAGYFAPNTVLFYGLSFVYDGIQESPIYWNPSTLGQYRVPINTSGALKVGLTITVGDIATINPRITHVNLYRGERAAGGTLERPDGAFRLLRMFECMTGTANNDTNGVPQGLEISGASHTYYYDFGDWGVTYEANSGLPETLSSSMVGYELSCLVGGYLFVGRCTKTGIADASHMIFRSKPFRVDTFDWTNDFLVLPTVPTAMLAFMGRLFVFDERSIYRVNVDSLEVEEVYPYGVADERSVCATEEGIFFANVNGAYHFSGKEVELITDAIALSLGTAPPGVTDPLGWDKLDPAVPIIVRSFPKYNAIAFSTGKSGKGYLWLFTLGSKRWDYWQLDGTITGMCTAKNGSLYSMDAGGTWQVASSSTRSPWVWRSKLFLGEKPFQNKRWVAVKMSGTASRAWTIDGIAGSLEAVTLLGKSLVCTFTGTEAQALDNFSIVFRDLEGVR
jgi:hypothetical protein